MQTTPSKRETSVEVFSSPDVVDGCSCFKTESPEKFICVDEDRTESDVVMGSNEILHLCGIAVARDAVGQTPPLIARISKP